MILRHLQARLDATGPSRLRGYLQVSELRSFVTRYGIERQVFDREIEALAQGHCVITEDFRVTEISDDDLVAISPAGIVHLDMMHNIYYLAAVAEDTWFFNRDNATAIANRIKDSANQYSAATTFNNALAMVEMIDGARQREIKAISTYLDAAEFEQATDMTKAWNSVQFYEKSIVPPAWFGTREKYVVGTRHVGIIQNIVEFGVFVDLAPNITALLHSSRLPENFGQLGIFIKGENVDIEIVEFDYLAGRISAIPVVAKPEVSGDDASTPPATIA